VKPLLVAEVKFTEWTADAKLRHPTYLGLRDDVDPKTVRKEPDIVTRVHVMPRAIAAERARAPKATSKSTVSDLVAQLDVIQKDRGDGVLQLPDGDKLEVTNLGKVFWPKLKLTKGDLLRH
jgi:bifunctional non-homologous end joining protein LigD